MAQPVRTMRQFESFENALQALETAPMREPPSIASSTVEPAARLSGKRPLITTWTETLLPSKPEPFLEPEQAALAVTCVPPPSECEPMSTKDALRILMTDDTAGALAAPAPEYHPAATLTSSS